MKCLLVSFPCVAHRGQSIVKFANSIGCSFHPYPQTQVEVWAFDEHRLGLKPIIRKVWSKRGQRPVATVHHRYQWLYLYAFVCPQTGQTQWFILPRVSVAWFNRALQEFAAAVGAGANKQVLLVIDGAGWHRAKTVVVPPGVHLEFLPPYSPELQPAERLWQLSDEPLVVATCNAKRFSQQSRHLRARIKGLGNFW